MDDRWELARRAALLDGAALRRVRLERGYTLEHLAAVLLDALPQRRPGDRYLIIASVDAPELSRIEQGKAVPSVALSRALTAWMHETTLQPVQSGAPTLFATDVHTYRTTPQTATQTPHTVPATYNDPHARRSDPTSSHLTVASIAADRSLAGLILETGARLGRFDDTDLTEAIETATGRRQQRNVIARARGLLEPSGQIVRLGPVHRDDRDADNIHFTIGGTDHG